MHVSPSQSFSRPPRGARWTPKKSKPGFNLLVLNKLNQHAWVTVGGIHNIFTTATLRMRVNPSLLFLGYYKGCPGYFPLKIKR